MTGLVDAQAHLDDPRVSDAPALLRRAADSGVAHVVSAGFDPRKQQPVHALAGPHACRVWRAYGIHPQAVEPRRLSEQVAALEELLGDPDVVAVGEIGLDGRPGSPPLPDQQTALERQLDLAARRRLPLILHCVGKIGRLVEILRTHGPLPNGGMVHGFGGPAELIDELVDHNVFMSFGGLCSHRQAKRCRRAAAAVPTERLLVESDCPDHPPLGWQHPTSEPASIVQTLRSLATLRRQTEADLRAATLANGRRLYRF